MAVDTTPPILTFTQVESPMTRGGPLDLEATAVDAESGVARVDFYVNDLKIGSDPSGNPYTARILTTELDCGIHSLKAVAFDNCDNATSATQLLELILYDIQNKFDISHTEWFLPLTGGHLEETSAVEELRVRPEDITLLPENLQSCSPEDYTLTFTSTGTSARFYPPPIGSFYLFGDFGETGNFSLCRLGFYLIAEEEC